MQVFLNGQEVSHPQVAFEVKKSLSTWDHDFYIEVSNRNEKIIHNAYFYRVQVNLFQDLTIHCTSLGTGTSNQLRIPILRNLRIQEEGGPEWSLCLRDGSLAFTCTYLTCALYLVEKSYPIGPPGYVAYHGDNYLMDFSPQSARKMLWATCTTLRERFLKWGRLASEAKPLPMPREPNRFSLVE